MKKDVQGSRPFGDRAARPRTNTITGTDACDVIGRSS